MISIIVPVFNSEKYLDRCVQSVFDQEYQDWELILVDDGSTDGSLSMSMGYAAADKRVKVLHQENKGPGAARNLGIIRANGMYTVFLDSDDYIKPDYLRRLSKEIADVVFIDVDFVDKNRHILRKEYMSEYYKKDINSLTRSQMTGKIPWGGCRKAVKTELLRKNNLRFSEHSIGEEAVYSFLLMHYGKTFSFINAPVYEYINRFESQSNTINEDPWGAVAIDLKNRVTMMGLYEKYADTINAFIATAAIVSLNRIARYYSGNTFRRKAKERIRRYRDEIDERYPVDKKNMPFKAQLLYPFLKVGLVYPFFVASHLNRARR